MRPPSKNKVEEHEIERAEDAEHQGLEHEEGDHIFLDALWIDSHDARMQNGIRKVVSRTKGMDNPSTPSL